MTPVGMLRSGCAPFVLALLSACAQVPQSPALLITGSASYRERIALSPQTVFEATVENVARADAASTTIGQVRIDSPQVPLRFSIPVEAKQVQADGRYVVRARIPLDGRLLFTSDQGHEVLGTNGVRHADILLRRVDAGPPVDPQAANTPRATAKLEDTYWKLVRLQGRAVAAVERQREPHLVMHSAQRRVAGSAGCNRLLGSYSVDGDRISFGRAAGTLMACPQGMEQERAFLDVLALAARWRIDAEQLELLDAQGLSLARFESVELR
ncbi:MAG: META domain-containing protein [Inhella sp.]